MLTSASLGALLEHINSARAVHRPASIDHRVGLSPTARNFISAYLFEPPLIDPSSLAIEPTTRSVWINTSGAALRLSLYGVLGSPVGFWYWLVAGDGFDVTKGVMSRLLNACGSLDLATLDALASIGFHLNSRRAEYLAFKKNSGKYVGNYNYSNARDLTARAATLFTLGSGFSTGISQELLDTVDRVLSINENTGEKGIPASVR